VASGTLSAIAICRRDLPSARSSRTLAISSADSRAGPPLDGVSTGKKVTITHGAALKGFQVPRVGRKFEVVVFGTLERG
jgi:hypothetical protein